MLSDRLSYCYHPSLEVSDISHRNFPTSVYSEVHSLYPSRDFSPISDLNYLSTISTSMRYDTIGVCFVHMGIEVLLNVLK